MKHLNFKILIFLLSLGVFFNCEDYIEEEPISEILLQKVTPSNVNAIITGIYEPLTRSRGRAWESVLALQLNLLEESIIARSGSSVAISKNIDIRRVNASPYWGTLYQSIGRANSLIASLENNTTLDAETAARAEAEARFARAFVYFHKVRFHGSVPMRLKPVTNSDETGQALTPVDEIYAQIIEDIKFCETALPNKTNRPGAPTAGAAKVMLADVYLTRANYAEAAAKAKEVIDNSALYGYELLPIFSDVFSPTAATHAEDVFSLKFSQQIGLGIFLPTFYAPRGPNYARAGGIAPRGLETAGITSEAPLIANWDDDDQRKSWTMYNELVIDGEVTNVVGSANYDFLFGKFRDPGSVEETASGNDWYVYRYADALLIFAEASNLANGGPNADAYAALNRVRERAYGDTSHDAPAGLSMAEFDDLVFQERGYEFLGEGKRWFDVKRKNNYEKAYQWLNLTFPLRQIDVTIPSSEPLLNDQIDN